MSTIKDFVTDHFKWLTVVISFVVTLYMQHVNNTAQILALKERCDGLEGKIQEQYEKIDKIKLDKQVFEATMTQFTSIHADLREMRADIKELLKNRR